MIRGGSAVAAARAIWRKSSPRHRDRIAASLLLLAIEGHAAPVGAQTIDAPTRASAVPVASPSSTASPSPPDVPSAATRKRQAGYGLIAGGAGLFLANYAAAAGIAATDGDSSALYVPVLGSWILLEQRTKHDTGISTLGSAIVTLDGVGQTAGLVMLLIGVAMPYVNIAGRSDRTRTWAVVPKRGGVSLVGSF